MHFRRVGEYLVGASHWLAGLCIVVAIVGLCVAAWNGRQAVRARYLLLLLLVVFIAGVAGKFPFGPSQGSLYNSGGRVSLWLIPVVAIGLAAALHGLRDILPGRAPRVAFDAAPALAAVAIVVIGLSRDQLAYPFPGGHSATQFIQSQLGEGDAVLLGYGSSLSYATESGLHSGIERVSDSYIGFVPTFDDPRVHRIAYAHRPPARGPRSQPGRPRVRLLRRASVPPRGRTEDAARLHAERTWLPTAADPDLPGRHSSDLDPCRRGAQGRAPASGNLALSDLPPGWRFVSSPNPPPGTRILDCLPDVPAGSTPKVVAATGPPGLAVVSQLDQWPSAVAASRAVSAFRPPGRHNVRSVLLGAGLRRAGLPLRVTVNRVPAPSGAGRPAVAYHVVGRDRLGGSAGVAGTVLFLARGRTTALVGVVRAGPGPFRRRCWGNWRKHSLNAFPGHPGKNGSATARTTGRGSRASGCRGRRDPRSAPGPAS